MGIGTGIAAAGGRWIAAAALALGLSAAPDGPARAGDDGEAAVIILGGALAGALLGALIADARDDDRHDRVHARPAPGRHVYLGGGGYGRGYGYGHGFGRTVIVERRPPPVVVYRHAPRRTVIVPHGHPRHAGWRGKGYRHGDRGRHDAGRRGYRDPSARGRDGRHWR